MRNRSLLFFALFSLPLSLAACGGGNNPTGGGGTSSGGSGGSGGAGGAPTAGLPCDVDDILAKSCRSCHASAPKFGAPMPLVTHDDLHAPLKSDPSKQVYEQITTRIHDAQSPMPPPPNPSLSDADAATLDAWTAAGAPTGEGNCGGSGAGGDGGGGPVLSCTPDVLLQPATPWEMPQQTTDTYVCYGVDVPVGGKRHVTALAPLIDNSTIVHHMLLFSSATPFSSTPQPCAGSNMGQLVAVWAPGGGALELPEEAGLPVEGTAHFILQIHYSNLMGLAGEKDASGYQLCTTDQLRPNDADIMAFGTWSFTIPAQGSADITCDLDVPGITPTLHGIAGMPHMHKLGTYLSTSILPGGSGAPVDIGTADPWNFESQVWTMLGKDTVIKPGDKVRTRCAWDNPTAKDVHFGEQTSDEMCFGFLMYYPRIQTQGWQWGAPALASTCTPTP
jgi:cytochrome c551/c552